MKMLVLVLGLAFVGTNSYAKGGCASGDSAKLLNKAVGLSSSFSISGTFSDGKDSMTGSDSVSVSGTAGDTQITIRGKTYKGAICAGKGHVTGTFSGNGEVASVSLTGKNVTIRSGKNTFKGTAQ